MECHSISTIQKHNWYINLSDSETITFNYEGQKITFQPHELINLLARTRVLVELFDGIMDLVSHKDQIKQNIKSL